MTRTPQCIVFDLDYTLWDLWVDTHVTPPLKRKGDEVNQIYDRYGTSMAFYPDVSAILLEIHHANVHLAVASRTSAPKAARQALTELLIPGVLRDTERDMLKQKSAKDVRQVVSSINLFDTMEIYPGSKLTHFKAIHKATGIPYEEMVFFDDESRNREVARLGVTFVLAPQGLSRKLYNDGLATWRKNIEAVEKSKTVD